MILFWFFNHIFKWILNIFFIILKSEKVTLFHMCSLIKMKTKKWRNLSKKTDNEIDEWILSNTLNETSWIDLFRIQFNSKWINYAHESSENLHWEKRTKNISFNDVLLELSNWRKKQRMILSIFSSFFIRRCSFLW
jgi:predicted CopG family antitoxin